LPSVSTAEADRCFPSHSPTLRPWIARPRLRCRGAPVLRGGDLEPDAPALCGIAGRNSGRKAAWSCNAERGGSFSLRRGLDSPRSSSS